MIHSVENRDGTGNQARRYVRVEGWEPGTGPVWRLFTEREDEIGKERAGKNPEDAPEMPSPEEIALAEEWLRTELDLHPKDRSEAMSFLLTEAARIAAGIGRGIPHDAGEEEPPPPPPPPLPVPGFTVYVDGLRVTVTNTTVGATSATFDFGDGSPLVPISPGQVLTYTHSGPGTYTYRLAAVNETGLAAKTEEVTVEVPPAAAPIADYTLGIVFLTATFTDRSVHATLRVLDWGDGSEPIEVRAGESVQHTYAEPGTYAISYTVSNETDEDSKPSSLTATAPPSGALLEISDPGTRLLIGPLTRFGDGLTGVDGAGNPLSQTLDRVPWPWLDAMVLDRLAEVADLVPAVIPEGPNWVGVGDPETGSFTRTDIGTTLSNGLVRHPWGVNDFAPLDRRWKVDIYGEDGKLLTDPTNPQLKGGQPVFDDDGNPVYQRYPALTAIGNTEDTIFFEEKVPWLAQARQVAYSQGYTYAWVGGYQWYYDLAMAIWKAAWRMGLDPIWVQRALKAGRAWFRGPQYRGGANFSGIQAPRMMAPEGVMLTALYEDMTGTGESTVLPGTSKMWNVLWKACWKQANDWIINKMRGGVKAAGVRDPGYALGFYASIGGILPDRFECTLASDDYQVGDIIDGAPIRDQIQRDVAALISGEPGKPIGFKEKGGAGFWGCVQDPSGAFLFTATQNPGAGPIAAPFHSGLLARMLVRSIKMLEQVGRGEEFAQEIAEAEATIIRMCNWLWFLFKKPFTLRGKVHDRLPAEWRTAPYTAHGYNQLNFTLEGTADLTPDPGSNTTTLVGTGTLWEQDGLPPGYPIHFNEELKGTLTINADGTVIGSGEDDFTEWKPGQWLVIQQDDLDSVMAAIYSIEGPTQLTLAPWAGPIEESEDGEVSVTPGDGILGSGRTAWLANNYGLSGLWQVDPPNLKGRADCEIRCIDGQGKATEELVIGDVIMVLDDLGQSDSWTVKEIRDDLTFVAGVVQGTGQVRPPQNRYWTQPRGLARLGREGEWRGTYRVVSVSDDTHAVVSPAVPEARSGVKLTPRMGGKYNLQHGQTGNRLAGQRQGGGSFDFVEIFGWLYHRTGDPKWIERGDWLMGSYWGPQIADGVGPRSDQYRGMYFATGLQGRNAKSLNQGYIGADEYMGYRAGGS